MNKARKIITLCLTISLIVFCVAFSYATPEQPVSEQGSSASEEELQHIAELSSDKYNHLLQMWSKDLNYSSDTDTNFPNFYGGSSTGDNNDMIIYVTRLDQDVIDYFGNIIDLNHVQFSKVTNSYQELLNTQEAIDFYIDNCEDKEICSAITGTGISQDNNAVNIYISSNAPSGLTDVILEKISHVNDTCKIRFITLDLTFGSSDDTNNSLDFEANDAILDLDRTDISSPFMVSGVIVQPGCPISPRVSSDPPNVPNFSAGFWAKNSKGEPGIVTTFHGSSYKGQPVYAYTFDGVNKVYFGDTIVEVFNSSVDATFVRQQDFRFNPITYVDGWDFNLKSQTIEMGTGEMVYKKGAESGVTRGIVLDTHFNASSSGDTNLRDAVLVNCEAEPGDSGGIVAGGGTTSSRYVAGILSGGGFAAKEGNPSTKIPVMYYSRASSILNALDLELY